MREDFQPDERAGLARCQISWRGDQVVIDGKSCLACGHHFAVAPRECRKCGGSLTDAAFGPSGEVWSFTVVHIKAARQTTPYTLAYIDLVGGPRIIAQVQVGSVRPFVGQRAELVGLTESGDPLVVCA